MQIIDYFKSERQPHWLAEISRCEWRAAHFLAQLLREGSFHRTLGRGTLFLLTDGDALASFVTLTEQDCIDDKALKPWIGFVHTAPEYRGRRCAGLLLDHAVRTAGLYGAEQVYICTDHVGLYEKYGFTYLENRISIYGEDSRVLVRSTKPPEIVIRPVTDELGPDFLAGFVRNQQVTECWRHTESGWQLVPCVFTEDWDAARLRREAAELMALSRAGKPAFVACAGEAVVGYVSLGERLGSRQQYMELLSFHTSEPWRGRGVGRLLFDAACAAARAAGAEKLYISAHSSKESQAAYRALGCDHAQEIDAAHVEAEPCDVQLEYDLRRTLTFRFGKPEDLPQWMQLVRRVAWNFPGLETEEALAEHEAIVAKFISRGHAVCALDGNRIVGVLLFSRRLNQLCCMAVAPEHRRRGAAQGMFNLMLTIADPAREITVRTFCKDDPKGAAPRAFYMKQGFEPSETGVEDGYPIQTFVRRSSS